MQVTCDLWNDFRARFVQLWSQHTATSIQPNNTVTHVSVFCTSGSGQASLALFQSAYLQQLFQDALLFGGCVIGALCLLFDMHASFRLQKACCVAASPCKVNMCSMHMFFACQHTSCGWCLYHHEASVQHQMKQCEKCMCWLEEHVHYKPSIASWTLNGLRVMQSVD